MACQIKHKGKTYTYEEWIAELHNGLLDQFVKEGKVSKKYLQMPMLQGKSPSEQYPQAEKQKAILERIMASDVSDSIKRGIEERGTGYIPKMLSITLKEADALIDLYGKKVEQIVRDISNGMKPDVRTAITARLYERYVAAGQNEKAIDIAMWQADQSLQAGRASNAAKIWKMITQSGEENIVLAIEKEQQKAIEAVAGPVFEDLQRTREDIEREIRRQVEARVQSEVEQRLERAKLITKEKKKEINDFFDSLKVDTSNKGMLSASVIPGITLLPHVWNGAVEVMKQAVLTGAEVANAIQAGIDYIKENQKEEIDEEKFKEFMSPKLEAMVPKQKIDRTKIDDEKIKVPKQLKGRKKKEFIDAVIDAINDGKLTDKKLEELYASKVGVKTLNEQDRARVRELAGIIDRAEKFEKELEENFTPENIQKYKGYIKDAQRANELLKEFATKPNSWEDTLISIMQGNLLSSVSIAANIYYNLNFQPLRFLSTGIGSMIDYSMSQLAKIGVLPNMLKDRSINFTALQKGWYRGAWNGLLEGSKQLVTGTQAEARELRDISSNFSPKRAVERWGEKDRTLEQKVNDAIEGTIGWEAEAMFRLLNWGDKPWRRAAELARAFEIAEKKKLKGKDLQKFLLIPDAESAEQIKQAGDESTFQESDDWGKWIQNVMNSGLKKVAEIPYIGKPFKILLKSQLPYIKTPWNVMAEVIQFSAPPITMGVGLYKVAQGNKREGSMLMGKAIVGAMIQAVAYQLFIKGLLTGDDDREEKKRNFQLEGTPPANSINISALTRGRMSGDYTPQDEDTWVSYQKMGVTGILFDNYSNTFKERERKGEPLVDPASYLYDMFASGPKVASAALDQTFLQGTSTFIEAIRDGGNEKTDTWIIKTSEALGSILYPNTIATISKASDEYLRDVKDEDFGKQLMKTFQAKMFMGDNLPAKVSIWGEPVTGAPEGRSKAFYYLFDPTKFRDISTQDFRYKIYQEFKKDGDSDWVPGAPSREITVNSEKIKLPPEQYQLLATYIGQERAKATQAYVNSMRWDRDDSAEKKEKLKEVYSKARDIGMRRFMNETGYKVKSKLFDINIKKKLEKALEQ